MRKSEADRKTSGARAVAAPASPAWQWGALGVLLLAGIAAYANTFDVPQMFDCDAFIRENFTAYNPPLQNVWPATFWTGVNRPVGFFTFGLNYWWGGYQGVWGYHAVNLAIHVTAAWLLFGVVRRTLSRGRLAERYAAHAWGLALAVALIWVVHPLQTASVTYIYQRLEALMSLFYLATLWCFIRALDSPRSAWWYVASVLCCLLGTATKEVMATAPVVVLWYDRVFAAASWRELLAKRAGYYAALACTWPVLAWLMVINSWGYSQAGVLVVKGVSPLQYALTQPGVILHYLRLVFWPDRLCFDYDWPLAAGASEIVPPLLAIGALVGLTVWAAYRWPAWGFLGGCFFLILAPTSSVAPLKDLAFEHRVYLPLAAVVTLVVLAAYHLARRIAAQPERGRRGEPSFPDRPAAAAVLVVPVLVVVVLLGWRTFRRNQDYASELSIWQDTLRQQPRSFHAHIGLGNIYLDQGNYRAALAEMNAAIEREPDNYDGWYNRAGVYGRMQNFPAAIADLNQALDLNPDGIKAYINRGTAHASKGEFKEAIADYTQAIRLKDYVPVIYYNRGQVYGLLGQQDAGQYRLALQDFTKAIELKPDYADAYFGLGSVHERMHQDEQAVAAYTKALALNPNSVPALASRAWLQATSSGPTSGDAAQAVADAMRACELTGWKNEICLQTLGAAWANQGDFKKAVQWQTAALARRPKDQEFQRAGRQRLELYRAGKPYREPMPGG